MQLLLNLKYLISQVGRNTYNFNELNQEPLFLQSNSLVAQRKILFRQNHV